MAKTVIIGAGSIAGNLVSDFGLLGHLEYIHDTPRKKGETKFGVPVQKRKQPDPFLFYVSCVGDTRQKRTMIGELKGANFRNFICDLTWIAKEATIGTDLYVQPFVVVYNEATIGDHVILLNTCTVGHGSVIGKYSIVCPEAVIGGDCGIGEGVWVGANSTIREKIIVGEGAFIGQGANVVEDVEPNTVVVGNPAKPLKQLKPW